MTTRLKLSEISYEATTEEEWQRRHKQERKLDELGFAGDDDVVTLGLDEIEDELTMQEAERIHNLAPFVNAERRRAVAIPVSSATVEEARAARGNEHGGDRIDPSGWDDEW